MFKLTDLAFDDMEAKYDILLADPSKENLDTLERAEGLIISQTEYHTCKEYSEKQEEYWKALDFMD
eukprot:4564544-Prorocentrum_lima.AAC.1